MLYAMRSMLVEFKRDNGRSESGSAEGSAVVGESPAGAGPAAVRETIVHAGGLRNFGETGHGEAAVPIAVGPERDQPNQSGRAGEMGVYPCGEFDGGFDLRASFLAYTHPPTFSRLK